MPPLSRREMLGALMLAAAGCESLRTSEMFSLRSQTPEEEDDRDELNTRVETPLVGDYVRPGGLHLITLQGVGLVVGLEGTGGDPPPSEYRQILLEEMKRRDVKDPNQILKDPSTALVIVQAWVPPLVRKGEKFDVMVRTPGNDETKSLNGGWLLETNLTEYAVVPGQGVLQGEVYAVAKGPILIAPEEGDAESNTALYTRGKILAGATSKKSRDMQLFLRNELRTVRNAYRVAERIGSRFFAYNSSGLREPLAEAKNDTRVELKILPRYKDNFPRYVQVIRHIAFRENDIARRVRMQKLKDELNTPEKSEAAALKLEAIGPEAVPVLKTGLENKSLEVRFHAGTALAYMEEPAGLKSLAEAAKKVPAFRAYALAAMASIDDAEAHLLLREMMSCDPRTYGDSAETRYGAFRALSTLDPDDPFIRGEMLPDQTKPQFSFHLLHTEGAPMVHLCNRRKAELVLFGADQRFRLPIAVRAGSHILVTGSQGSESITVSRHAAVDYKGRKEVASETRTVSTRVEDVIRAAAELRASYPDIVQMLVQADRQHNLPGRLEIDAMPRGGRVYVRDDGSGEPKKSRVGDSEHVPNIYDRDPNSRDPEAGEPEAGEPEEVAAEGGALLEQAEGPDGIPIEYIEGDKWYDVRRFFKQTDRSSPVPESGE